MVKLEDRLSDKQKEILLNSFGKLKNKEIAELINEKVRTVSRYYQKKGMVLSKTQRKEVLKRRDTKYSLNHSFFSSYSKEAIYWAGFIAADGCVTNNRLQIKLKFSDINHLKKFKKDINYTGVIKKVSSVINNKEHFGCLLYLHSEKVLSDLEKFNIFPRKSLTFRFPELSGLDLDYFIKGYFDGDGSVYRKGKYTLCSFYGTFNSLKKIKERVDFLVGKNSGSIFKKENIFCYQLNSSSSLKFLIYYKKLEAPELERKWCKKWF